MADNAQEKSLEALKVAGVLTSLKRYGVKGEITVAAQQSSTDEHVVNHDNKTGPFGTRTERPAVHAQRATMIVRIEELLTSYGLDPNRKPGLLAALDKLHTAHTDAEIAASIAAISSIVTAAETSSPETASPMTFNEFEKRFDAAWSKYDRLEKETRTTMEKAAQAGYISKEDEDKSKQQQKTIEEHKKEIDVLTAKIHDLPDGAEKEKLYEDVKRRTIELAQEIIQHTNHDKKLIEQAIKVAKRDHNDALVKDLQEALPKKDEEAQAGTELYDLGAKAAISKRQEAFAEMKRNEMQETSEATSKPTNTSTLSESANPMSAPNDIPELPPKPIALNAADTSNDSLGALSPAATGVTLKSTGKGVA